MSENCKDESLGSCGQDRQKPAVAPDMVPAQTGKGLLERLYIKRFQAVPFLCGQNTTPESQNVIESGICENRNQERSPVTARKKGRGMGKGQGRERQGKARKRQGKGKGQGKGRGREREGKGTGKRT